MEPEIQYVRTADGVSIAYAVSGGGPPLLHMPNLGVSMLQVEREIPERRNWIRQLEKRFTVTRYDARGCGYSQRDVDDLSVGAHLLDLDTVAGDLGIRSFTLFGFLWSAYVAPYYAATHPETVSRLILWPPDTRRFSSQEYRSLGELAASDWETFTETYAHIAMGWDQGAPAHRYARIMRDSISPQAFLRQVAQVSMSDLTRVAARVQAPVLVLQRKMKFGGQRVADLASALPDARLHVLDGDSTVPYLGNVGAVVGAMATFAAAPGTATGHDHVIVRFPSPAGEPLDVPLSAREREILRFVAAGRSNQEIAEELVLSVRTVERHLYNVYSKIGASGKSARAAAAAYASARRLA